MGWHDDGVALGLWGNDGMPYGLNSSSWNDDSNYLKKTSNSSWQAKKKRGKTPAYNASEQQAYDNGYRAVYDSRAYNGRYFQKDGKIWIHNMVALKKGLGVYDEDELEDLGYDVSAYYRFN